MGALQPGTGLGRTSVDRRLIDRIETVGLGEAAVFGRVDDAAGHQRVEVVLHRQRSELLAERGRRLAGSG